MASNLTLGLPREGKPVFDSKLDEGPIEEFEQPNADVATKRNFRYIRIFGLAIALFAAFVSWVNSFEWFAALRPLYVAVPMAFTMIGSSVLLPDFGIILIRQKRRVIGGFIILSGVLATVFCMVTTVAALYNSRSWNLDVQQISSSEASRSAATLKERTADRTRLIASIATQEALIASTQGKIDAVALEDTAKTDSQILIKRLNGYLAAKTSYERELQAVNADIIAARGNAKQTDQRKDIYVFLGEKMKMDPTLAEFYTVMLPAVFLEVVAPVMVAIVMFL